MDSQFNNCGFLDDFNFWVTQKGRGIFLKILNPQKIGLSKSVIHKTGKKVPAERSEGIFGGIPKNRDIYIHPQLFCGIM